MGTFHRDVKAGPNNIDGKDALNRGSSGKCLVL
jgi:hypothetical protein